MDARRRGRDEPFRDGVCQAPARRIQIQPAMVHSRERSRSVRPRHAGNGPYSLGRRASSRGEPALFETRSGLLTARPGPDGIELDFPSEPVSEAMSDPGELAELQSALGAPVQFAGKNRFDLLVELESEEIVRGLRPDFRRLEQYPVRGVIATSRSRSGEYDLVSRFFAPGSASTKIRSAARRTAVWARTGPRRSAVRS